MGEHAESRAGGWKSRADCVRWGIGDCVKTSVMTTSEPGRPGFRADEAHAGQLDRTGTDKMEVEKRA
jgi:hypothetical protein